MADFRTGPMARGGRADPRNMPIGDRRARAEDHRRIDFLVIGAPKSGTTTLHVALSLHPSVRVPSRGGKELRHFDAAIDQDVLGVEALSRYHSAWDWDESGVLRGEASPRYLASPHASRRMRQYRQDIRLIAIFRAPAMRAYSDWNMAVQQGRERCSFDRAVRDELAGVPGTAYVEDGRYASQPERLAGSWPGVRLLALRNEDLALDPRGTFNRVCDFLGLEHRDFSHLRPRSVRFHLGAIHPSTARFLDRTFGPEIDRLEAILSWDPREWRRTPASVARWTPGEAIRRLTVPVPGLWRAGERARSVVAGFRSPWSGPLG